MTPPPPPFFCFLPSTKMCVASHHLKQACITWPATPSPTTASLQCTTTRHRLAQNLMTSLAQALSDHRFRDQRQPILARRSVQLQDTDLHKWRPWHKPFLTTDSGTKDSPFWPQIPGPKTTLSDHRARDQRERGESRGQNGMESGAGHATPTMTPPEVNEDTFQQ